MLYNCPSQAEVTQDQLQQKQPQRLQQQEAVLHVSLAVQGRACLLSMLFCSCPWA